MFSNSYVSHCGPINWNILNDKRRFTLFGTIEILAGKKLIVDRAEQEKRKGLFPDRFFD